MASVSEAAATPERDYAQDPYTDDLSSSESATLLAHTTADSEQPLTPVTPGQDGPSETENPNRPKGFRFAVVFACILMADFFVGYVSTDHSRYVYSI